MFISNLVTEMIINLQNDNISALEKNSIEYKKNLFGNTNPTVISNAFGVNGLFYIPNYISKTELSILKNLIINDIKLEPISSNKKSRRVAHYGFYYSYDHSGLKTAEAIPDNLKDIVNPTRINNLIGDLIDKEFEQVIINEYQPGQQISYHTDHNNLFGPIIACITIGESVPIKFKLDDIVKKIDVAEGSMYIMTCDARYKWKHALQNNKKDTRYSITYRTINKNQPSLNKN